MINERTSYHKQLSRSIHHDIIIRTHKVVHLNGEVLVTCLDKKLC